MLEAQVERAQPRVFGVDPDHSFGIYSEFDGGCSGGVVVLVVEPGVAFLEVISQLSLDEGIPLFLLFLEPLYHGLGILL